MVLRCKKNKEIKQFFQFDFEIENLRKEILKITIDQQPEIFLMEMLKKSASYN